VEITLENIYYDFDRWEIREDARPTLDELARNLQLNPDIRIQLASHTDCRGTTRYNEELSQKRAQSAVDYLISKGIAPERLIARGFGENVPAADCICNRCTEEQHQENRRTTFAILE
ncbi:MAG: OmpA family protein, partial [Saprospiraceae bacterium]|nr:OmpA family protein [Saprospiraceae bacterium]